jgi:hypothetical protein
VLALCGLINGVAGYCYFERMSLPGAYVNAAMILSGMGPLGELKTTAGKLFAALTVCASAAYHRRGTASE